MDRRGFSKDLLLSITGVAFMETLFRHNLFAQKVRPVATAWLKELQAMCLDLRTNKISPLEWQAKIDEFHRTLPLEDLLREIDFENAVKPFAYPDLGVVTSDPIFPKIEGMEKYAFKGRIFGMRKDRAIIPHGHRNMTSCHRVLKGEFLLRQYDRLNDDGDCLTIRQTIEEKGKAGSFSSISDDKNNVHWLVASTAKAFTFDVIVSGIKEMPVEIDNLDMYAAVKETNGLLRVRKMEVGEALRKYGKSHH